MHKTTILWLKLSGASFLAHTIAVILLFFVYQDGVKHLSLVISPCMRARDIEFRVAIEKIAKQPIPVPVKQPVAKPTLVAKKADPPKAAAKKAAPAKGAQKRLPDHLDLSLSQNKNMHGFEAEFKLLYQELSTHWAPPPGVPADSQCAVTVFLDRQGEIADMLVDSSSGMLVFDLAARSALSELEFPKFVWGKSITITFTL